MTRKFEYFISILRFFFISIWKSQVGKGGESRRPTTADSAKTSNIDSDDNSNVEESN